MDTGKPVIPAQGPSEDCLSLYVHIPFCETKCPYCDFNTYAGIESLILGYVAALEQEIRAWGTLLDHPGVTTIFFGGGTPSYLPAESTRQLLAVVGESFDVSKEAEVTLEANPGDLDQQKLETYLQSGINRLSIGVQSLDDELLTLLGRRHDSASAIRSVELAYAAGFDNLSVDLMFGLPHQTIEHWRNTLESSVNLKTQHISMYALTLEPNTPLEAAVRLGQLPEPDQDLAADMYLLACERLESQNYEHYEISNWAEPGFRAQHNLAYWRSNSYLGVGPGAHSYLRQDGAGIRFENTKPPRGYIDSIPRTQLPVDWRSAVGRMQDVGPVATVDELSDAQEISDYLMMGLRLFEGISRSDFNSRFETDLFDLKGRELRELGDSGLIEVTDDAVRIPHDRWLVGNEVFVRLVETAGTEV